MPNLPRLPRPALLLSLALIASIPLGCGDGEPTGPELTLVVSPSSLSLFPGETGSIVATVPQDASAQITFTSSATGVASVDGAGTVTAAGIGNAIITVAVTGTSLSETVAVTVTPSTIAVAPTSATIAPGGTVQLTATVTGGAGQNVSWASSATGIAGVSGTGLVTGVANGSATITASVDGQPGVAATATITVVAPPTVTASSILDASGMEADLSNVTDSLVFEFQIEGEEGASGEIQVLVDGKVVGSTPFSVPMAVAGPEAVRRQTQVTVPVDILQVEDIGTGGIQDIAELIPPGAGQISGRLQSDGSTTPITLRGQTSLQATFNQRPLVLINGKRPLGPTAVGPNGVLVTRGLAEVDGEVFFDEGQIKRVEIVTAGATAIYGSDAVAGVVNYIVDLDEYADYEGPFTLEDVRAFDASDDPVTVDLALDDPRYAGLVDAPLFIDTKGPEALGSCSVADNFAVGRSYSGEALINETAQCGEFADATSFTTRVDARAVFGAWEFENLAGLAELEAYELDGRTVDVSFLSADELGNETRRLLTLDGTSSFAKLSFDLRAPTLTALSGPSAIRDGQLGVLPGQAYFLGREDPGGTFGSFYSGFSAATTQARVQLVDESGITYPLGGPDSWETIGDAPFTTDGFSFDYQVSGEYNISFRGLDNVGNASAELTLRAAVSLSDPVIGAYSLDGPLVGGAEVPFSEISIQGEPGLRKVATGWGFPGVMPGGERLFVADEFELIDPGFNNTFTTSLTYNGVNSGFIPSVSPATETFPQDIGVAIPADVGAVGALTTGFTMGVSPVDITGINSFEGVDWGAIDATGLSGPSTICVSVGGTCPPGTTTATFQFDNFIPGNAATGPPIAMTEAQLFAISRLDEGTMIARPVSERIEIAPSIQDFGSFRQWTIEFTVDSEMQEFSPLDMSFAAFGFDEENNAVMSYPWTVGIEFKY
jgi:hypothetical protein